MKKISVVGFILSIGFYAVQLHAVDIRQKVYVPQIDGLDYTALPSLVDEANKDAKYTFSMDTPRLDKLLKQANLPSVCDRRVEIRNIPQCRVSSVKRSASYQLSASDRQWLKQQSWWCRFTRKLFGACKPSKLDDILSLAMELKTVDPEKNEVSASEVKTLEELKCVSEAPNAVGQELDALKVCASSNTPYDENCVRYFKEQKLSNLDKHWVIDLKLASDKISKEVLPSLQDSKTIEKKLKTVRIGTLELSPQPVQKWLRTLSIEQVFATLNKDIPQLGITGTYMVTTNDVKSPDQTVSGSLDMTWSEHDVENYPAALGLKIGEILSYEEKVVPHEFQANISDRCKRNAWRAGDDGYLKFICNQGALALNPDVLATKFIRMTFLDQMGKERSVTWNRPSPIESCSYDSYYSRYSCTAPQDRWSTLLRDDSELIQRFLVDSGECCQELVFNLNRYLPLKENATPLGKDSIFQSQSAFVRHRE